jgi:CoA-transferase family III
MIRNTIPAMANCRRGSICASLMISRPCAGLCARPTCSLRAAPGTLGNRGLSPEELARLRPGLVCVALCAFSRKGPWASRRGFDTVVQNVSGITTRQGELFPGAVPGPQFYPVSAIDYLTGYLMAFGATVVLARRAPEGGSWLVRVSSVQTGRWLVGRGEVPAASLKDVPKEIPSRHRPLVNRKRHAGRAAASSRPHPRGCRRRSLTGPAPRSRSATTSPSGPPAPRDAVHPEPQPLRGLLRAAPISWVNMRLPS